MSDSMSDKRSQRDRRQQWGMIIEQSAKQYQKMQSLQKQKMLERKIAYKNALDQTLQMKKIHNYDEREQDRKYYQAMMEINSRKEEQQLKKKKQHEERLKMVSNENRHGINSRMYLPSVEKTATSISIGQLEQNEPWKKFQTKKALMEFYENHVNEKKLKLQQQKMKDAQLLKKQADILNKIEEQRNIERERIKNKSQDPDIYRYYNSLNELKKKKQQDIQNSFVRKAMNQMQQKQQDRLFQQKQQRQRMKNEVKQSILEQIEKHNFDKEEYKRKKSQDKIQTKIGQGELKKTNINKSDYLSFLLKQQQLHKRMKSQSKYMNDLQYRFNLQQLNKAQSPVGYKFSTSPLYIGSNQQQQKRKDQLYFKNLGYKPILSSRENANNYNLNDQEDMNKVQKKLDQSVITKFKPPGLSPRGQENVRQKFDLMKQGYNIVNGIYT